MVTQSYFISNSQISQFVVAMKELYEVSSNFNLAFDEVLSSAYQV